MRIIKLFIIFFPFLIFGNGFDEYYAQTLTEKMQQEQFDECLGIIECWEKINPEISNKALGIKAAIYFSKGDLQQASSFMASFVNGLSEEEKADPIMDFIINSYNNGINSLLLSYSKKEECIHIVNYNQPPGVKLKYWVGLGQVVTGLALMPFNPTAGYTLIGSGGSMLFSATCDALDNKAEFERNLQERQRMYPEFQQNSYVPFFFRREDNLNKIV